jgi:hypothetical protein
MHSLGRHFLKYANQLGLPVFPVKPRNIKALYEPKEFHAILKVINYNLIIISY